MSILAALLTIVLLGWVFKLIIGTNGAFSLRRAMQPARSFQGEAVGRLLSLLTIATALATTEVVPTQLLAQFGAPAVLATSIGVVVAPVLTDRLLSLLGVVLALAVTANRYGMSTAVAVFAIAALGVWMTGLIRGFTGR